jgi:hypothetical protein
METPMAEIRTLNPHDPLPEFGQHVVVLRRFDEEDPHKTVVEVTVTHGRGFPDKTRPGHPDGRPMTLEEAVRAAGRVADAVGIATVHVIDRTAGPRERDIMRHGGDHSIHSERLDDTDLEEGERGPDMRDRS